MRRLALAVALFAVLALSVRGQSLVIGPARTPMPLLMSSPQVPSYFGATGGVPMLDEFRLSVVSMTPIPGIDEVAQSTIYFTPYTGQHITVFDPNGYATTLVSSEISIVVPAVANQLFDVFVYNNGGVPKLEAIAWTNDTTRSAGGSLVRCSNAGCHDANGMLIKTVDYHRYVGSFRTLAAGQTEDSQAKRLVYNYYNRSSRTVRVYDTSATTYTYTVNQFRQVHANPANQVAVVQGINESSLNLITYAVMVNATPNDSVALAFGLDSTTTAFNNVAAITQAIGTNTSLTSYFSEVIPIGYHVVTGLEASDVIGTLTWSLQTGGSFGGSTGALKAWTMVGTWSN